MQIVQQSTDLGLFNTIYATAFEPITWQTLPQVLEIDPHSRAREQYPFE